MAWKKLNLLNGIYAGTFTFFEIKREGVLSYNKIYNKSLEAMQKVK